MSVNPGRRRLKGPERRELILDAARKLFAAKGYDAVSLGDVAAEAGITRPVLYDHFASKKELVLHLLTVETDALIARVSARLHTAAAPSDRMSAALRAYFEFMLERPLGSRLILTPATDPDVAELAAHMRDTAQQGVLPLLATHPADDHGREIAATVLVSSVVAVANWWLEHPEVPLDTLVDTTMNLLTPGLSRLTAPR